MCNSVFSLRGALLLKPEYGEFRRFTILGLRLFFVLTARSLEPILSSASNQHFLCCAR